jgi:hypothetical protein
VRVLSDGDNGSSGAGSGGGPQSTTDSIGTAQVGPVRVDAPVRVVSDGSNGSPGAGSGGGPQSTQDSEGTAQVGSVRVNAPIRVASDGDDGGGDTGGGAPAPSQAEPPPSGGEAPADSGPGSNPESIADEDAPAANQPAANQPAADVLSGGGDGGADGEAAPTGSVRTLGEGSLPVTGLGLLVTFLLGLVLMANGSALRTAVRREVSPQAR